MIDREREAEAQEEGEAGSMLGARRGTPGSCPRPKAGAKPLSHPGCPMSAKLTATEDSKTRHWCPGKVWR